MKSIMIICILLQNVFYGFCQGWTNEQLQKAGTAADEYKLTDAEKEAVLYINLCRLYPAEFAEKELKNYTGVPNVSDKNFYEYKTSLVKELELDPPGRALMPDELLYDDAKCYGNEISVNQRKPHQRINCIKRNYAECLFFGSGEGRHIALQWLIDSGVESLGHRKICLSGTYRKIGIKINTHFEYGHCAVAEFDR